MVSWKNIGYDITYPDRLTSCGGTSVSYNAMGYPTTYDGYTASWTRGKLSRLTRGNRISGTHTYSYNYNALGQRISRGYTYSLPTMDTSAVVAGMLTGYSQTFKYDQSGRLVYEVKTSEYYGEMSSSDSIVYLYDESSIIGMVYTSETGTTATYYFHRNLLGDVIGIYNTSGTKVGGYAYDAWGNCTITLNTNGIATRNPIRYRGYYYDEDTKLYYLNSRYYCPKWHRFISPDDTAYLDPESVNGLNPYAYCNNDPVNYADQSGCMAIALTTLLIGGLIAGGIGAGIGLGTAIYNDVEEDGVWFNGDWTDYVGRTLGGLVAGFGIGVCTVLGAGVGAATLGGTTANLFISNGLTLSLGSALGIGSGVAFSMGMAGYAVRAGISKSEDFKVQNMFIEGGFNAISGALSVFGGYLGGIAGVHNTVFTKLLSQKGDFWLRLLVENAFTTGFKLTNALIKPYFMI